MNAHSFTMDGVSHPASPDGVLPPGTREQQDEREPLRFFWDLYQSVRGQIECALREKALAHPEFVRLSESLTPKEIEETTGRTSRLQERAVRFGEWEALEQDLENQGAAYAVAGISFRRWFELISAFRTLMVPVIVDRYATDPRALLLLSRGMSLYLERSMAAIGEGYLRAKEEIIGRQKAEIRELFTPVLQLEERLLVLPLVGTVGPVRAQQITDQLLRTIRHKHARAAVIDVTGVPGADQIVAQHLLDTVEAARLMGAVVFVTGLSSETARSLVDIGVDISRLNTRGDLQSGVEGARRLLAQDDPRRGVESPVGIRRGA